MAQFAPAPGGGKTLGQATIPTSGGVITTLGPDSSVHAISISFGAASVTAPLAVAVSSAATQDFPGRNQLNVISPLIQISTNSSALLTSPARLTIRTRIPSTVYPVVTMIDPVTGRRAQLPTVARTDTSVTALILHFDTRKIAATLTNTAASNSLPQLAAGSEDDEDFGDARTTILIDGIPTELLNRPYDTGFRPSKNGWEFEATQTTIGSSNWGAAFTALWYYAALPGAPQLFNQYQKAAGVPLSNRVGLRWSAVASKRINLHFARGIAKTGDYTQGVWADNTFATIKAAFARAIRPEPQLVILSASAAVASEYDPDDPLDPGAHAVIAYRTEGNTIGIYDPRNPGDDTRTLTIVPQQGMTPYAPGSQTAVKYDVPVSGSNQALVPLTRLNTDWLSVLNGTIGSAQFAESKVRVRVGTVNDTVYVVDSARVWIQCATCTLGYPSTTVNPPLDGPVIGANVYTFNKVPGEGWKSAGGTILGNGTLITRTVAGDETLGFVQVAPNAKGQNVWHDWTQLLVRKFNATITPGAPTVAQGVNQTLAVQTDMSKLPAGYKIEWLFGDAQIPQIYFGSNTTQHSYVDEGTYPIKATLIHPVTSQVMTVASTTATVTTRFPVWRITSATTQIGTNPLNAGERTAWGNLTNAFAGDSAFWTEIRNGTRDGALVFATKDFSSFDKRGVYLLPTSPIDFAAIPAMPFPMLTVMSASNNQGSTGTPAPFYTESGAPPGNSVVTGMTWKASLGTPRKPYVHSDSRVTFSGTSATGEITTTYVQYGGIDDRFIRQWTSKFIFVATRVR